MEWDSGIEYEMFMEEREVCSICGQPSDNLTCGYEWDIDLCCAECADQKAWEEELESEEDNDRTT